MSTLQGFLPKYVMVYVQLITLASLPASAIHTTPLRGASRFLDVAEDRQDKKLGANWLVKAFQYTV